MSRRAYESAAATAVPAEPPTSRPSRRASSRAVWKLSASPTRIHSSTTWPLNVLGTKSSPIPSTFQGLGESPERTEPSGSAPMTLIVGVAFLQEAADAGNRAAGADAGDEGGDPAAGLLPDLGAGGAVVDLGVGEVGELVRPPRAGISRASRSATPL